MSCVFKGTFTERERERILQAIRRLQADETRLARPSKRWIVFKMMDVLQTTYAAMRPHDGLVIRADSVGGLLNEIAQHRHRLKWSRLSHPQQSFAKNGGTAR